VVLSPQGSTVREYQSTREATGFDDPHTSERLQIRHAFS
jgi:hypothetical protein